MQVFSALEALVNPKLAAMLADIVVKEVWNHLHEDPITNTLAIHLSIPLFVRLVDCLNSLAINPQMSEVESLWGLWQSMMNGLSNATRSHSKMNPPLAKAIIELSAVLKHLFKCSCGEGCARKVSWQEFTTAALECLLTTIPQELLLHGGCFLESDTATRQNDSERQAGCQSQGRKMCLAVYLLVCCVGPNDEPQQMKQQRVAWASLIAQFIGKQAS